MMPVRSAFLFCIFFTVLGAFCGWAWMENQSRLSGTPERIAAPRTYGQATVDKLYRYPILKITHIVDGDTFDAQFHIWEDTIRIQRVRLPGVDTPERKDREPWIAATEYVRAILENATEMALLTDWKSDSFGRLLADVQYVDPDGSTKTLAAVLLESGYAEVWKK